DRIGCVAQVALQEMLHHGPAFEIRRRGLGRRLRGERKRSGRPSARRSHNRRVAVFVDANDRGRLQAHVDGESERSEGNHAEDDGQQHRAVGIGAQHPVVFVILRVQGHVGTVRECARFFHVDSSPRRWSFYYSLPAIFPVHVAERSKTRTVPPTSPLTMRLAMKGMKAMQMENRMLARASSRSWLAF